MPSRFTSTSSRFQVTEGRLRVLCEISTSHRRSFPSIWQYHACHTANRDAAFRQKIRKHQKRLVPCDGFVAIVRSDPPTRRAAGNGPAPSGSAALRQGCFPSPAANETSSSLYGYGFAGFAGAAIPGFCPTAGNPAFQDFLAPVSCDLVFVAFSAPLYSAPNAGSSNFTCPACSVTFAAGIPWILVQAIHCRRQLSYFIMRDMKLQAHSHVTGLDSSLPRPFNFRN